jgi:hypothetical protein
MKKINSVLLNNNTHPEVAAFIMDGLSKFRRTARQESPVPDEDWKKDQIHIGWFNFLTGFISNVLVEFQNQHYRTLGSTKKGVTWAGQLIIQGWSLLYAMWAGRNDVLHQKDIMNSISGETLLDIEIEREYDLGYDHLPPMAHKWFRQSKAQLLQSSVTQKKGWLLIVRSFKEALQIADYSIFASSKALRKWIGLQKI